VLEACKIQGGETDSQVSIANRINEPSREAPRAEGGTAHQTGGKIVTRRYIAVEGKKDRTGARAPMTEGSV